jgi:CubicO group peptidase (beta-lactamase class C family)
MGAGLYECKCSGNHHSLCAQYYLTYQKFSMKTNNDLQSFHANKGFVVFLALLLWCLPTIQAQKEITSKGYGKAVYQGLPNDIFLKKWLVLGPLPVSDKKVQSPDNALLKNTFDKDLFALVSVDSKKSLQPVDYAGRKFEWKYIESASDKINLNTFLGDSDFIFCYALAEVVVPEQTTALFGLGSDDGVKMWINGKEVHSNYIDRSLTIDNDIFEVTLTKGSNQLLLKIQNSRLDYGFALRRMSGPAIGQSLLRSAETGDFDNIKTLMKYSPDLNQKDKTGLTAWQLATIKGRTEIAEYLKQHGAVTTLSYPPLGDYVDSLFAFLAKKKAPGAAILVSQNGKILYKHGYGMADIGYSIPVSTVTKFRIGSITKQFIATAILKLQEEGKISVTDKLSKFIPDFPRGNEVTIHHLLTHTSGIHSFTNRADFLKYAASKVTAAEMMDTIKAGKYDFNPGEKFMYNNSGYFILGYIIEKITGQPFGEYLTENFFKPLGMKNTGVHSSNLILENEATGYDLNNGQFEKALNWDMSRAGGAGSLYSTVEDLNLWNEAIFNGKVLKEQSLKSAFTVVTLNNGKKPDEMDYSYGWVTTDLRNLKFINHGGGLQGFLSHLLRQPDENLTVTVLTNCTPAQENIGPEEVGFKVAEYLLWPKMSKQQSYTTDTTLSAEQLKIYEGRYDYGGGAVLTVMVDKDKLMAQMTGQAQFQIFPKGNDEFYWKVVEARIKFNKNAKGEIETAIHYQGGREMNVKKLPEINLVKVDQSVLDKYVGNYQYDPNTIISITTSDGRMFAQAPNQNKIELFPVSETEFAAKEMDANLKFIPDKDNAFKMIIRLGGNERTINKVK